MTLKINDWYVSQRKGSEYIAPEARSKYLVGVVEAPGSILDGSEAVIALSAVVKSEGRIITAYDGQSFELGTPQPDYLSWLIVAGVGFDEVNPIKLVAKLKYGGLVGKQIPPSGGMVN